MAEALDLSSDQALEGGLKLVKLMQGLAPAQPAPKAHTPMPPVKELSYRALADLYHADPAAYRQQTHEIHFGGQEQWK